MKLTALTCMYDKPLEVMRSVLKNLREQTDEMIAVLDRPSPEAKMTAGMETLRAIVLDGPPGWNHLP